MFSVYNSSKIHIAFGYKLLSGLELTIWKLKTIDFMRKWKPWENFESDFSRKDKKGRIYPSRKIERVQTYSIFLFMWEYFLF